MYESFGLIGIQLPEKYKENFDVSSEGTSICTVIVFVYIILDLYSFTHKYNLLKNERMFAVKCGPVVDVFKTGLKV